LLSSEPYRCPRLREAAPTLAASLVDSVQQTAQGNAIEFTENKNKK